MREALREILEPQRQAERYILLPDKSEPGAWRTRYEPKRAFNTVRTAAGLAWVTPHVLRHTFVSLLIQEGTGFEKVRQWAGHTTAEMTSHYSHLQGYDPDIEKG